MFSVTKLQSFKFSDNNYNISFCLNSLIFLECYIDKSTSENGVNKSVIKLPYGLRKISGEIKVF